MRVHGVAWCFAWHVADNSLALQILFCYKVSTGEWQGLVTRRVIIGFTLTASVAGLLLQTFRAP